MTAAWPEPGSPPALPPEPTTVCAVCDGEFTDNRPGRVAHVAATGHQPHAKED